MGITLVGLCLDEFTCKGLPLGGYCKFFWNRWVKYRSDPSASKAVAFFAQDDQVGGIVLLQGDRSWEDCCSVEALAEISRFVAGLVQRIPKKASVAKLDLQNSTAILPRKKRFEEERIGFKDV